MPFLARLLGRSRNKTKANKENKVGKGEITKPIATKNSTEHQFDENSLYVYKHEIINDNINCPVCHSKPIKEIYVIEGPYFNKNGNQINALIKVFVKQFCGKCGHEESKRAIYIPLYGIEILSPFFTEEFKSVIQQINDKADKYMDILGKVLI